jgi:hypothetical protein
MTDNLFINAMDSDKLNEINAIKKNKGFAMRILNNLSQVFRTYDKVEDECDRVIISMKTSFTSNYYGGFTIIADKNGLFFNAHCLGYYFGGEKPLGFVYDKYKEWSKPLDSFVDKPNRLNKVIISIPLDENDVYLKDKLKDIIYLMEQGKYVKIF